jgi:hypothetical protein
MYLPKGVASLCTQSACRGQQGTRDTLRAHGNPRQRFARQGCPLTLSLIRLAEA